MTDAQANTGGSHSIHFTSSNANGGPQDVVLDFGQQYTDGVFTFESAFYISAGAKGYFNFQATPVIGTTWALNVNMDNEELIVDDGVTSNLATGSYADETWFTLKIEANLTLGLWKGYIDGNLFGTWSNGINEVASLDIFPIQGSNFYVDDVNFDHQPYTLDNLNAINGGIVVGGNLASTNVNPIVNVINGGVTSITSFDITIDYNGNQYVENVSGQNIASSNSYDVEFTTPIPLVSGSNVMTATISNVNGGTDDVPSDDVLNVTVDPITPAPGKIVVGEEATGTWCAWCPRGAVFMDRFEEEFGDLWAGIAVHNGDPMTVETYDTGLGTLISGYPSSVVDRGSDVDPSSMYPDFYERIQIAPKAVLTNGATWDPTTRELTVSIKANFQDAASDQYKMLCVLTEDGVTGTSSDYNQSNAYAGGGNGVMGGYENLPSPVPASQMVYDHVARAISNSFVGDNACFPASISSGDMVIQNFTFILPADWDENNIHIIGMLLEPNGRVNNGSKSDISTAVSNGFEQACALSVGEILPNQLDAILNVYPNPAQNVANIEINVKAESQVELRILDMSGKVIGSKNYGTMTTSSIVPLNTSSYDNGVYVIELSVNGKTYQERLIIQ